ncbi:MAG: hypothetical protein ACR2RE_11530 [Geminicoccaceae bacterium]
MTDTQTVADESNAKAKPSTEEQSAQEPSIDDLLKEFETDTKPEQTSAKSDVGVDDLKEVVSYVREDRERRDREQTQTDIAGAVKAVKGDLAIDDDLVEGLLYRKANTDQRFLRAFQLRHESPGTWANMQKAMHRELADKVSAKPDEALTDDRQAVEAAVRSASTGSSEDAPPDFNSMTDQELNAWQRKHIK